MNYIYYIPYLVIKNYIKNNNKNKNIFKIILKSIKNKLSNYIMNTYEFSCKKCKYFTNIKEHFIRHCNTFKHNRCILQNGKPNNDIYYKCTINNCNKLYKTRSGLRKHKVNKHNDCITIIDDNSIIDHNYNIDNEIYNSDISYNNFSNNIIHKLMNENKELQNKLIDIAKEPRIINQTNNNQKTFNIIQFLNHECKDAMNITDFIKSLVITFDDLEQISEYGYLSNVKETLVKSLTSMEQNKRPIHCTDTKRKQFYVKDKNEWNKDTSHGIIKDAINDYNNQQLQTLTQYKHNNPNWMNIDNEQIKINNISKELTSLATDGNKITHKLLNHIGDATAIQKE